MNIALQTLLCGVLLFGGVLLLVVAHRSAQERLGRNRFVGVRTSATMRSDDAFRIGNREAASATRLGGVISVVSGVAVLFAPAGGPLGVGIAIVGTAAMLGFVILGGVRGHRAAQSHGA
ncbi:hypothetical protein GIY23_22425 [Allosaccharopolyspora coralli]|uniref:SdpI family protein n=1 Tax=Allosaccharopolyspora coralli TaxID=2665642 RepID=A0A5Q3QKC6_9PSEU|nr:SdpI family protein [Allosaccharopolyspora coralli]QGK71889.1 hypothetical protein GIY23_22425 [Allosaccharopolyspora coralli]